MRASTARPWEVIDVRIVSAGPCYLCVMVDRPADSISSAINHNGNFLDAVAARRPRRQVRAWTEIGPNLVGGCLACRE